MKQFTTWSYSQVKCWQQCPHRAKLSYLDKVPQGPPAPALVRGSAIHKEAENYILQKQKVVPESLTQLKDRMIGLQKRKPDVELVWGFNRDWVPTDPWGKNRWLKVILDVHFRNGQAATVIDYKTGKMRVEDHQKQMGLYALGALITHNIKRVYTELWYVDHGQIHKDLYESHEVEPMKEAWTNIVAMMEADTIFPKKPGPLCRWCPFHNTVHCEF